MKIAYHAFETETARGGALFYYSEVSRLLNNLRDKGIRAKPHNLFALAADEHRQRALVNTLGEDDLLVCNMGPYAHLYHYLRERHGGRFRIVRDVRTSSWAGFFLQEAVSGPLTRNGDLVVFPSEFCRQYFLRLFPGHLHAGNTTVSYPLADSFSHNPVRPSSQGELTIGYFGRISDDKNFDQVLDAFISLSKTTRNRVHFHLAGSIDPLSRLRSLGKIKRYLRRQDVPTSRLQYFGLLPYRKIWEFLSGLDVFLFPAIASVESLGRVLLEAQFAGVKVVAAHYAAAAEILPASNLVTPHFISDTELQTIAPMSLGRVDQASLLNTIESARHSEPMALEARYQSDVFLEYIVGARSPTPLGSLSNDTRRFIDAADVSGLLDRLTAEQAMALGNNLLTCFARYTDNNLRSRLGSLIRALPPQRSYSNRRTQHLARLALPQRRTDLGNAREQCHAADFAPLLWLDRATLARDHPQQRFPTAQAV
jgi:glycosyltransferase involved in cell wall biosynthesis